MPRHSIKVIWLNSQTGLIGQPSTWATSTINRWNSAINSFNTFGTIPAQGGSPHYCGRRLKPQTDGDDDGDIDEANKKVPDAGIAGEPRFGTDPFERHCDGRSKRQEGKERQGPETRQARGEPARRA